MNRKSLLTIASAIAAIGIISVAGYGCGDDDSGTTPKPDGGGIDSPVNNPETTPTDSPPGNPAPPTLGAQIDRMGRPAINTALNHTFDTNDTTKGAAKDAWNADKNVATWVATYRAETSGNLAVLDALDDTCGNQAFADTDAATPYTNLARYGTFGSVAADDRLWIKMDAATCTTYLAVEADATKFLANQDCGGRSLSFDVIDITYSLATNATLSDRTDGIAKVDAKTNGTTFPFLAAPVQ